MVALSKPSNNSLPNKALAPLGYARVELQAQDKEDREDLARWMQLRAQKLDLERQERDLFHRLVSRFGARMPAVVALLETAEAYMQAALEVAAERARDAKAAILGMTAAAFRR